MYDAVVRAAALARLDETGNLSLVSRETGVSRSALRGWQAAGASSRVRAEELPPPIASLPPAAYAYLLGLYLGDGCVSKHPRTWVLRITLDAKYPGIIREAAEAIAAIRGRPGACIERVGCCELVSSWSHWPHLLPQHGPGRKHERIIRLESWQASITHEHPERLLRGLIHSDGCRFVARQRARAKTYSYVRYSFSNRSDDIRAIFCRHLDLLGIRWTRPNRFQIAIDRREEVAKVDAFVGPKQ